MATLTSGYEATHFPMTPADPIDAIKFCMEQQGVATRDLTPVIGQLNRIYEVLARRRPWTMSMVWRLHTQLGIPAKDLIQPLEASVGPDRPIPSSADPGPEMSRPSHIEFHFADHRVISRGHKRNSSCVNNADRRGGVAASDQQTQPSAANALVLGAMLLSREAAVLLQRPHRLDSSELRL